MIPCLALVLVLAAEPATVAPPDTVSAPAPGGVFDHSLWDGLLGEHVHEDRVDYEGLLADRERLDDYLESLAAADPDTLGREEQLAFWIDAYNALMVDAVLDAWPVGSVLDIGRILGVVPTGGVFREPRRVAGQDLSLDDIEHRILRERFGDARTHAALNCASRSCPALPDRAFTGADLDARLDAAMLSFLLDGKRNRLGADPPMLSSIFRWYRADFEAEAGSVWEWVRRFLPPEIARELPEEADPGFLSYDWALNDR